MRAIIFIFGIINFINGVFNPYLTTIERLPKIFIGVTCIYIGLSKYIYKLKIKKLEKEFINEEKNYRKK